MNTTLTRFNNAATFLTFALSLAVKGGYNYGAGILFLAALLTLPKWWQKRPRGRDLSLIMLGFLLMGSIAIIDAWHSGLSGTYYNIPVKYLAVPLILAYLTAYPPDPRAIWWGAAAGALLGLATALYYTHCAPELLPDGRAARYLHPIQLGNLAARLGAPAAAGRHPCRALHRRPLTNARQPLRTGLDTRHPRHPLPAPSPLPRAQYYHQRRRPSHPRRCLLAGQRRPHRRTPRGSAARHRTLPTR